MNQFEQKIRQNIAGAGLNSALAYDTIAPRQQRAWSDLHASGAAALAEEYRGAITAIRRAALEGLNTCEIDTVEDVVQALRNRDFVVSEHPQAPTTAPRSARLVVTVSFDHMIAKAVHS
jgi:hypothetical protein